MNTHLGLTLVALAVPVLTGTTVALCLEGEVREAVAWGTGMSGSLFILTAIPQHLICRWSRSTEVMVAAMGVAILLRLMGAVGLGLLSWMLARPVPYALTLTLCTVGALLLDASFLTVTNSGGESRDAGGPDV